MTIAMLRLSSKLAGALNASVSAYKARDLNSGDGSAQGLWMVFYAYTAIGGIGMEGCYVDVDVDAYSGPSGSVYERTDHYTVGPTHADGFITMCPLGEYPYNWACQMTVTALTAPDEDSSFTASLPYSVNVVNIAKDSVPIYCQI